MFSNLLEYRFVNPKSWIVKYLTKLGAQWTSARQANID